ncbi:MULTISPECIES: rod shape-determining protein MreD [unclassified Oceanobacter]|uniref:rod shape-determining protein MreD n=1 Tax=unclassified Oceanobacter TaxID=2620260 RepID=UPI0026E295AD|nr:MULTISPECIES: rod shape-determining protein MreD [unclassified Oceanobacter]MDO6681997.1 rod shape-determining protein MreD [Oceanobacter sp. 5_MG-2023]MDP2505359.1 rod shape-determining protein MreD [Oceanobacter sp. 3_MG-2023]MDP2548033.1 rod shape-determining protein MreD [Oceanobacter sp. 4_MG-2023]MDP2610113.1 rod shape-determining protein MreD [Oceanobacter sp. 1_MG-2023]MDP2612312.1 rod shape-determining protein MreD [Oceanobacter sp. 2_MG-2023]
MTSVQSFVIGMLSLFVGFVFEHLPLPELLIWFQPLWILVVITLLVFQSPQTFGLWLAIPAGLMMDAEQGTLLGTHVFTLSVHIFLVQYFFRRIEVFNLFQQMALVLVLALLHQLLSFWLAQVMLDLPHPVEMWGPAFSSMFVWPWVFALTRLTLRRMSV